MGASQGTHSPAGCEVDRDEWLKVSPFLDLPIYSNPLCLRSILFPTPPSYFLVNPRQPRVSFSPPASHSDVPTRELSAALCMRPPSLSPGRIPVRHVSFSRLTLVVLWYVCDSACLTPVLISCGATGWSVSLSLSLSFFLCFTSSFSPWTTVSGSSFSNFPEGLGRSHSRVDR